MDELVPSIGESARSLEDTIRELLERIIQLHTVHPRMHRVLFEEVPLPAHVRRRNSEIERRYAEQTEAGLRQNAQVRVSDYRIAAHIVVQASRALSQWLVHDGPHEIDGETFLTESARMLAGYLSGGIIERDRKAIKRV